VVDLGPDRAALAAERVEVQSLKLGRYAISGHWQARLAKIE
jgi:hypothetical protein